MTDLAPLSRPARIARGVDGPAVVRAEEALVTEPRGFAEDFEAAFDAAPVHRSSIGCIIPACNEQESIAQAIESLLQQTRVPDVIHVVVNNTADATVKIASHYAGPHELTTDLGEQFTEVFVHDIGRNPEKMVGARNYGYTLVEGYDYLLGMHGDTVADARAVEHLEAEAASDPGIGGISAISAVVLGGRFSLFSTQALRDVMAQNHQSTPWVKDSDVEDSLLSLQIKSAGYLTRISPFARADVFRGQHGYRV